MVSLKSFHVPAWTIFAKWSRMLSELTLVNWQYHNISWSNARCCIGIECFWLELYMKLNIGFVSVKWEIMRHFRESIKSKSTGRLSDRIEITHSSELEGSQPSPLPRSKESLEWYVLDRRFQYSSELWDHVEFSLFKWTRKTRFDLARWWKDIYLAVTSENFTILSTTPTPTSIRFRNLR